MVRRLQYSFPSHTVRRLAEVAKTELCTKSGPNLMPVISTASRGCRAKRPGGTPRAERPSGAFVEGARGRESRPPFPPAALYRVPSRGTKTRKGPPCTSPLWLLQLVIADRELEDRAAFQGLEFEAAWATGTSGRTLQQAQLPRMDFRAACVATH